MKNNQVNEAKNLSGQAVESPHSALERFACGHPISMRNNDDVHYCGQYPNGVHYSIEDDEGEEEPDLYWCPWCGKDNQTTQQIRKCSGFRPSGMPPNETGHEYGCGCADCRQEYQRLK